MNLGETLVLMMLIGTAGGVVFSWIEARKQVKLGPPSDPEALLHHRYARGEIDEEEYQRKLSTMRFGPPLSLP